MSRLGTREQRSLALLILTFVSLWMLGTIAWYRTEPRLDTMEALYRSLQMFSLNFTEPSNGVPVLLEIARFAQPTFTILAFAAAVSTQLRLILRALVTRRFDQVTIIGYGVSGKAAAERFRSSRPDARIVALDHSVTEADARTARRHGVELIECDVLDSEARRSFAVGLTRSREVVIACGADQTNLSLLDELSSEFAGVVPPVRIWLHLASHSLAERLRESYARSSIAGPVIEFVEIADHAAQAVLLAHPLALEAHAAAAKCVHVVIHGFDDFGWLCAEQVLLNGIFPEPTYAPPRVTIIVPDTIAAQAAWRARHPGLDAQLDVRFAAPDASAIRWTDADDAFLLAVEQVPPTLHVFAGADSEAALTSALALRDAMRRGARITAPIAVRSDHRRLTGRDLTEPSGVIQHRLTIVDGYDTPASVFGIVGRVLEQRARLFHDAYARQSQAAPFDRLPHSQRLSNRRAAFHLLEKLRMLGFEQAYPRDASYAIGAQGLAWLRALSAGELAQLDRLENLRWRADRLIEGWRAGRRDSERRLRDGLRGELRPASADSYEQRKDRSQIDDFISGEASPIDAAAPRIVDLAWEGEPPEWDMAGDLALRWRGDRPTISDERPATVARLLVYVPPVPALDLDADEVAKRTRAALMAFGREHSARLPGVRLRYVRPPIPPWNWLPPDEEGLVDGSIMPRLVVGFTGHRKAERLGDVASLRMRLREELQRSVPAGTTLVTGLAVGADTMVVELWSELNLGSVIGVVPRNDDAGVFASEATEDRVPDRLIRLCTEIIQPDLPADASDDDRHEAVAETILSQATLLIAVSDGVSGGRGGVEDIVARARARRILVRYWRTSS